MVGRPDCALLVLSPLTDLHAMKTLRTFELDSCSIGDAGVAVLAAALRNGALSTLEILDLRRNQARSVAALIERERARAVHAGRPRGSDWHGRRTACTRPDARRTRAVAPPLAAKPRRASLLRWQVTDGGAQALATALTHRSSTGPLLPRLHTLGLDANRIGDAGLNALAHSLLLGAVAQLRSLFVDRREHCGLRRACDECGVELVCW